MRPHLLNLLIPAFGVSTAAAQVLAGPAPAPASAPAPAAAAPEDADTYDIDFKPGHFICMSCDVSACDGCGVALCDLSQCVGEFYQQECWCQESATMGATAFLDTGREAKKKKKMSKAFCDADCTGGVCDTPGFQCRTRQEVCQPWWICGPPPEEEAGEAPAPQGLLQLGRAQHLRQPGGRTSRPRLQLAQLFARTRQHRGGNQGSLVAGGSEAAATKTLSFRPGRFACGSAALPPELQDPDTMESVPRGYIVLDQSTCEGSLFATSCYCWDNFKYLGGEDPMTSELQCDEGCRWGPCEGSTCSARPPPPLAPLPRPPLPALQRTGPDVQVSMVPENH